MIEQVSSLSQAVSAKAAEAVANVPSLPQGPFLTLLVTCHAADGDGESEHVYCDQCA